jgi:hypothetical protein
MFCVFSWSQDRLFDKVVVDFPQNVHINDQVVPAGHYELRQLRDSGGGARVIGVTTEGASRFETAVISIPALNNNTPDATRVILQKVGPDYYLDKIWISGKDYGYEFTIPDDVKSRIRERSEPLTLSVKFQSFVRQPQNDEPVARTPVASPPPQAEPQLTPAPPPRQVAQAAPPPAPEPAPQTQSAPAPVQPQRLPDTASHWPITLAVGIVAITAAFFVRRLA